MINRFRDRREQEAACQERDRAQELEGDGTRGAEQPAGIESGFHAAVVALENRLGRCVVLVAGRERHVADLLFRGAANGDIRRRGDIKREHCMVGL